VRGTILALDTWLDPNHQVPRLAYLDVCDWEAFVDWLAQEPSRALSLRARTWRVRLFKNPLNRCFGGSGSRTRILKDLGIELDDAHLYQSDEMFIAEVLRVYFGNDPNARPQAELLTLARRQAGNSWITVISQNRCFWRVPMVNNYFLDYDNLQGYDDLPAQFDFFMDLDIHNLVRQAAERRIQHADQPTAIIETVKELCEQIRIIIGSTQDGYSLMEEALSFQRNRKTGGIKRQPRLKLNPMTVESEWNEQRGYHHFACGVASALRNPMAHQPADRAFVQSRYGDNRKALKVLCFLSLLFEKLDERVP
jgi:uncharacterized protein (TIGR02391 family)